jgi:hypothetical protein
MDNYILIVQSCGAPLAFQSPFHDEVVPPAAIAGVEGIYDVRRLRDDHEQVPIYQYFTENAFGRDEVACELASPEMQESKDGFAWDKARVAALAHSEG